MTTLTVEQAAEMLKCHPKTIYDWVQNGRIPYRKAGGLLLFDLDEILAWLKEGAGRFRENMNE